MASAFFMLRARKKLPMLLPSKRTTNRETTMMAYTRSMEPLVAFAQTFKLAAAANRSSVVAATAGYAWWQMQISKMMTRYR